MKKATIGNTQVMQRQPKGSVTTQQAAMPATAIATRKATTIESKLALLFDQLVPLYHEFREQHDTYWTDYRISKRRFQDVRSDAMALFNPDATKHTALLQAERCHYTDFHELTNPKAICLVMMCHPCLVTTGITLNQIVTTQRFVAESQKNLSHAAQFFKQECQQTQVKLSSERGMQKQPTFDFYFLRDLSDALVTATHVIRRHTQPNWQQQGSTTCYKDEGKTPYAIETITTFENDEPNEADQSSCIAIRASAINTCFFKPIFLQEVDPFYVVTTLVNKENAPQVSAAPGSSTREMN